MKKIIWFTALLPLLYIVYKLGWGFEYSRYLSSFVYAHGGDFLGRFPNDPLKFTADLFGISAIHFLIATLSITPLRTYLKINLVKYRRLVGLWAFAYAFMHSLFFFIAENEGSLSLMYEDMIKRPFVFFGAGAFVILAMMAITSPKKLYAKFVRWHKLVYLATVFIALHYMMSQKVIGLEVAVYVGILAGLLALRLLKR
jgi:methionine sulfoxide reductase heme-binding subunit